MVRIQGTSKVVGVNSARKPIESPEATGDDYPVPYGSKIPWKLFRKQLREDFAPHKRTAGMHFGLLAPTRGGKTVLATKGIIPIFREADIPVLVIDSTSDPKLADYGDRMPRFGKMTGLHRISIDNLSRDSVLKIYDAMTKAYKQGDILIYVDELRHVADPKFLGLGKACENIWLFGGKRGVTFGACSQAPRWLPSAFYDQSKLHFLFRIRDIRSRKRIEEISGDTLTLREIIPNLSMHNFAYVNPDGDVSISKYDLRGS